MGRYPWAEALLFEILRICLFYPTRHHAYRAVVLAAIIYIAAQIYQTSEVTDPLVVTFLVGCTIVQRFMFAAYILFTEGPFPDHWRRVRDEVHTKGGSDSLPSNFPFPKKLQWMVDIGCSVRMVGWVQEPRNYLPPHPPPSRPLFLWKTFLKLIINAIIIDFASLVLAQDPAFDSRIHDPTDGPETYLAAVPLLRRAPYVLAYCTTLAAGLVAHYNALALVCVGLGRSSSTLWPDFWGQWGDAYTVRRLWGRTWHQSLRPMVVGLGRFVANKVLKVPRGTNWSSYIQLYIAFFLSGLLHSAGDFMFERRLVYRSFKFFLLQAVAITFEDFVIYIARRLLRQRGVELKPGKVDESSVGAVVRVIGYCWVTLWFCLALPVWADGPSAVGFSSIDRGPITRLLLDTWKQWA